MITRNELSVYLHDYLRCDTFHDFAPNGLQIEGKATVHTICTAVTASAAVIAEAIARKADALLVHHGYFWRGEDLVLTGMKRQRTGLLMAHNTNLYAYHLPLDCHEDIGNNACLGRLFGVEHTTTHAVGKTPHLLWSGFLKEEQSSTDFARYLTNVLNRAPLCIGDPDKPIRHIAWCSGAAQDMIEQAHRLGVDAYLSGEISERTYYQANELGLSYFSCGHHATERYGIQALCQHIEQYFSLSHHFIDSDNPV